MTRERDLLHGPQPAFIDAHSVFTLLEFREHYLALGRDPASASHALDYFVRERRIGVVRRELYARNEWVDPWLLASKVAPDVVISHEGALSFHGFLEVAHALPFMTAARMKPFQHREVVYQPFRVKRARLTDTKTTTVEREGQHIRVQTLEAALVDCLAELDLGPDFDTLVDVFKRTRTASDADVMVNFALARRSPLLMSRLGFVLTCTRGDDLSGKAQATLEKNMLPRPDYFRRTERTREDKLLPRWNLILTPEQWTYWRR